MVLRQVEKNRKGMLICSNEILFTCFFFGILNEFWFKSFGYNDRSSPVYIEYYPEILHHLIENATLLHITSLKFTLCCDIRVACFHFDKRKKNFARLYVLKSQMEFFFRTWFMFASGRILMFAFVFVS